MYKVLKYYIICASYINVAGSLVTCVEVIPGYKKDTKEA